MISVRWLRSGRGQATVEFALVLPLLLLLLVGIVEFGLFTSHMVVLRSGSYDLVRLASVDADESALIDKATIVARQVVGAAAAPAVLESGSALVVEYEAGGSSLVLNLSPYAGRTQGDQITVDWAWHFRPIFVGWILGESDLTVSATGVVEYPPPD